MNKHEEYYKALLSRDSRYEGVFFVGVRTTGVFCRPTCPARKPKFDHCEFFESAQQALLASYRPCKRCHPLSNPNELPKEARELLAAVEKHPEKKWKSKDLEEFSFSEVQARRVFKKYFGMTFVEYARACRMGMAMQEIRSSQSVIEGQLIAGYESGSGFRDAFSKIMGKAPLKAGEINLLKASWIETPMGPMIAIADEKALFLLEFVDRRGLEGEIERLRKKASSAIIPGKTMITESIEKELKEYFEGKLRQFQTPFKTQGTPFQERVWELLRQIPYGETCSYLDLAKELGNPKACRAVARANGTNQLALVIPCHRVINTGGGLGGYGGGVAKKCALLRLEGAREGN